MSLHLVTGGVRSGKSSHAEHILTQGCSGQLLYVATAAYTDDEMQARIKRHQQQRSPRFTTLECPTPQHLLQALQQPQPLLLECMATHLGNIMHQHPEDQLDKLLANHLEELCQALLQRTAPTVVVSNEVGYGVVPVYSLGRLFRDHMGWYNQALARIASSVTLVVAGLPLRLK